MPASLDARRRAVADALRAVAREGAVARTHTEVATPAAPAAPAPSTPPPAAPELDVRAVESQLDTLSRQVCEVLTRLGSVETAVLESVWERQAPEPAPATETPYVDRTDADRHAVEPELAEEEPEEDPRVSVPAVPLGEVRMSSAASRALFGG